MMVVMRAFAMVSLAVICLGLGSLARADDDDTPRTQKARPWAYPENLVKADGKRIRNGCLPGIMDLAKDAPGKYAWVGKVIAKWRFLNRPSYKFEVAYGEYETYQFDFTKSCNLHDAGYEGQYLANVAGRMEQQPLVLDQVLNEYVDYSSMSQDDIDARFLKDMRAQCVQQIDAQIKEGKDPRGRKRALDDCLGNGDEYSFPTWGAESLYEVAHKYGDAFYRQ